MSFSSAPVGRRRPDRCRRDRDRCTIEPGASWPGPLARRAGSRLGDGRGRRLGARGRPRGRSVQARWSDGGAVRRPRRDAIATRAPAAPARSPPGTARARTDRSGRRLRGLAPPPGFRRQAESDLGQLDRRPGPGAPSGRPGPRPASDRVNLRVVSAGRRHRSRPRSPSATGRPGRRRPRGGGTGRAAHRRTSSQAHRDADCVNRAEPHRHARPSERRPFRAIAALG